MLPRFQRAGLGLALPVVLPVALPVVLAAACALGCGDSGEGHGDGPPTPVVELVTVQPQVLRNLVDIPGQLASEFTAKVRPEIEGILDAIHFAEGDHVVKGTPLFTLRDEQQRAELAQAEASLKLAEATYRRTATLKSQDVSSEAQLERAQAELAVAKARVEVSRVGLARMTVRAPFDGLMGALWVSPGDRVTRDTVLTQADAITRLQLLFYLPEQAVSAVRPGIPVSIKVAPFPDDRFAGEVYFVSPTLEAEGRRILVKAWIPNPDRRLLPGLFAEIEAEIARREDALLVPDSALVYDLEGTFLWKIDAESRAHRVPIEVGLRQEGKVEVAKGLAPGDVVVAAGIHKVKDGQKVKGAAPDGTHPVASEDESPEAKPGTGPT
jgi:membrane fusion protein, multidrug efflux system